MPLWGAAGAWRPAARRCCSTLTTGGRCCTHTAAGGDAPNGHEPERAAQGAGGAAWRHQDHSSAETQGALWGLGRPGAQAVVRGAAWPGGAAGERWLWQAAALSLCRASHAALCCVRRHSWTRWRATGAAGTSPLSPRGSRRRRSLPSTGSAENRVLAPVQVKKYNPTRLGSVVQGARNGAARGRHAPPQAAQCTPAPAAGDVWPCSATTTMQLLLLPLLLARLQLTPAPRRSRRRSLLYLLLLLSTMGKAFSKAFCLSRHRANLNLRTRPVAQRSIPLAAAAGCALCRAFPRQASASALMRVRPPDWRAPRRAPVVV